MEFRADVERFERFVEQGHRYVVALEQLIGEVRVRRSLTAGAIGYGVGPADSSTRWCEELVAEAAINNAFVAGVAESLQDLSAVANSIQGGRPPGFDAFITSGLAVDGTDLDVGADQAMLAQLRTWPLRTAGVSTDAIAGLIADAATHRAALALLDAGVHPLTLSKAEPQRVVLVAARSEPHFGDGRTAVQLEAVQLEAEHLEALLSDGYGANLHRRIMAGELAPPDSSIRDAVVDAMVAGLTPSEMGVAAEYFPAFYRPGGNQQLGNEGEVEYFAAVAATSDVTAGSSWEGQIYGSHFNGFHQTKLSGQRDVLMDPDGNSVELAHMGTRLAVDPNASVSFFNRIGVARAADLPTFLAGSDLGPGDLGTGIFELFSRSLAGATMVTSATGSPALAFSGAALFEEPKRETRNRVIWYSPALLFTTGRFASTFLADATAAVLRSAERGEEHAVNSYLGSVEPRSSLAGSRLLIRGGEDPRNILLDRAADDLDAVADLIGSLAGWSGEAIGDSLPNPGALDPLLRPAVAFQPSGVYSRAQSWLDRFLSGATLVDADHPRINAAGQPVLASSYPITEFLAAAGNDDRLTRTILHTVAYTVSHAAIEADSDRAVINDPGTASGLDLLLARNAALLIRPADLGALSLAGSTLNADTKLPVGPEQWLAVYGEILRHGRGQALAAGLDQLLERAIGAAVGADGWFRSELAAPIAQVAGRTTDEATGALISYSAELDQLARDRNRQANLATSVAMSALGFLPMFGLGAAVGSAGWAWFFDGYPTDNELRTRTEQAKQSEWHRSGTWEAAIADQHLRRITGGADPSGETASPGVPGPSTLDVVMPGVGVTSVPVRRQTVGDVLTYRWQHPETGDWQQVPSPSDPGFESLFGTEPPGESTSMWLNIAESRDLIDHYQHDGTEGARLDEWIGPRRFDGQASDAVSP